jgi:hypothetical protein
MVSTVMPPEEQKYLGEQVEAELRPNEGQYWPAKHFKEAFDPGGQKELIGQKVPFVVMPVKAQYVPASHTSGLIRPTWSQ